MSNNEIVSILLYTVQTICVTALENLVTWLRTSHLLKSSDIARMASLGDKTGWGWGLSKKEGPRG